MEKKTEEKTAADKILKRLLNELMENAVSPEDLLGANGMFRERQRRYSAQYELSKRQISEGYIIPGSQEQGRPTGLLWRPAH